MTSLRLRTAELRRLSPVERSVLLGQSRRLLVPITPTFATEVAEYLRTGICGCFRRGFGKLYNLEWSPVHAGFTRANL
jgi:hypothetical protein